MTATARHLPSGPARALRPAVTRPGVLVLLAALLVAASGWSLTIGPVPLSAADLAGALFAEDGSRDHLVVASVRLPRLLAALLTGAGLAVSGAIMQAVTFNPLASPGLLGINAGAAFAVVIALVTLPGVPAASYVWCAFAGAAVAAVLVQALGSVGRQGATPLRLALAGAILSAFLGALTATVLIFDRGTLDAVRVWTVGSLDGRAMAEVAAVAPYVAAGLAAALVFRGQIATLSLGAEIARQVGQNVAAWRCVCATMVVLMAGGAVAVAGPIGFVGLVVPHLSRFAMGADYRWILPACALGGALLVVTADAAMRAAFPLKDIPVGISMAALGAPFLIWLARNRTGGVA